MNGFLKAKSYEDTPWCLVTNVGSWAPPSRLATWALPSAAAFRMYGGGIWWPPGSHRQELVNLFLSATGMLQRFVDLKIGWCSIAATPVRRLIGTHMFDYTQCLWIFQRFRVKTSCWTGSSIMMNPSKCDVYICLLRRGNLGTLVNLENGYIYIYYLEPKGLC